MIWNFTDDPDFTPNERKILDSLYNQHKNTRDVAVSEKTSFTEIGKISARAQP